VLRDGLTGFLQIATEIFAVYDGAAHLVADLVKRHQRTRLIDLCSGGGGPLLRMQHALRDKTGVDIEAVMTDLYPNLGAFDFVEEKSRGKIKGVREAVDATNVPADLDGVRTLFNAFHHFRPARARGILADAALKRQPLVSLEVVERRFLTLLFLTGTPLAALLVTPWARPLTPGRLFFTYVLLGIWWDGMMSCLRAYSVDELRALTADLNSDDYVFRIEQMPVAHTPLRITALIGEPR
jgi:hypothetical protein